MEYPRILLPRQIFPVLENEDVKYNAFVRETKIDVYPILAKSGYEIDDILPLIVAPQPSLREVFELSVFLYGYYDERHIGIRVSDITLNTDWNKKLPELKIKDIKLTQENAYPLFLAASSLNQQEAEYNGETYILSFSHKPTHVNYWHFQLWVKDNAGNRIPRNKSNVRIKYLAKSILEYIVTEAVISKSSVKPFKRSGFE